MHQAITAEALPFLRIRGALDEMNLIQDFPWPIGTYSEVRSHHFCGTLFDETTFYINQEYNHALEYLANPAYLNPSIAAYQFGMALHTIQDFYAHSNWVEIWTKRGYYSESKGREDRYILYEPGTDYWTIPGLWAEWPYDPAWNPDPVKYSSDNVNIMVAQTKRNDQFYIPDGWTAKPGWELLGYPKDPVDAWNGLAEARVPVVTVPSEDGYEYFDALESTDGDCAYAPIEMNHNDILKKDNREDRFGEDAYWNAVAQTEHEWFRFLNLAKGPDFAGSSAVMAYFLDPDYAPASTGPINVRVSIDSVRMLQDVPYPPEPTWGTWKGVDLDFSFVLYTGDFQSWVKSDVGWVTPSEVPGSGAVVSSDQLPETLSLRLEPSDTLVISLQSWINSGLCVPVQSPSPGQPTCTPPMTKIALEGVTLPLSGSRLMPQTRTVRSGDLEVTFTVSLPIVEAGGPYAATEGGTVHVSGCDSWDPGGAIVSYAWDDDGDMYVDSPACEADLLNCFGDNGYGEVYLKVTDDEGLSNVDKAAVYIDNATPIVEADEPPVDKTIECGLQDAAFSGWFIDPGWLDTHTAVWDWGDGSASPGTITESGQEGSGSVIGNHIYNTLGIHTVTLTVTDDDGGVGVDTLVVTVEDKIPPSLAMLSFPIGSVLEGGVRLVASAADPGGGVNLVTFSIRQHNGWDGIPIGFEDIPAIRDPATGNWALWFDTLQLLDGYYVVVTKAIDIVGNVGSTMVPCSIRNWVALELLPSGDNNKAGRTVPVKFSMRVSAAVNPVQPFVYNEELMIKIYATSNPGVILQTSVFGTGSTNYRVDTSGEKYITNFKTSKVPMQYTVEIWRGNFLVGSFTFKTVK